MKKIGKKLSFLTKITLVIGLIISNLSSLTVVFAKEKNMDINVNEDNKLVIKYFDLEDDVTGEELEISEKFYYLDNTPYKGIDSAVKNSHTLTNEDVLKLKSDGLVITESILNDIEFDGEYTVSIKLGDRELEPGEYTKKITHDSGLKIKVKNNADGTDLSFADGKYIATESTPDVSIYANVLSGGFSPEDDIIDDDSTLKAKDFVNKEILLEKNITLENNLYGDYKYDVSYDYAMIMNDATEEKVSLNETVTISYKKMSNNGKLLNTTASDMNLDNIYEFNTETENGYVLLKQIGDLKPNLNEIYKILSNTYNNEENSYVFSNLEHEDIIGDYLKNGDPSQLEEYLSNVLVDKDLLVAVSNEKVAFTLKCIVLADFNEDGIIDDTDLSEMIDQILENEDMDLVVGDVYKSDDLNTINYKDAIMLKHFLDNGNWKFEDGDINNDTLGEVTKELVNDQTQLESGDKFTLLFKVKLGNKSINGLYGLVDYDHEGLELLSINANEKWIGNNNKDKFMFIGQTLLDDMVTLSDEELEETEYDILSFDFVAKKAGEYTVSLKDVIAYDYDTLYIDDNLDSEISVVVDMSKNNNLSKITINGEEIALEDDNLNYTIILDNSNDTLDVEAFASSDNASVEIVNEKELIVGNNLVTIKVTSESGDVKVYTINVVREELKEEVKEETNEETVQINYTNNDNYTEPNTSVEDEKPNDNNDKEINIDDEEVEEIKKVSISKIIVVLLIIVVIIGLVYLIFKDDTDNDSGVVIKQIMPDEPKKVEESISKETKQKSNTPNKSSQSKANNIKNTNTTKKTPNKKER